MEKRKKIEEISNFSFIIGGFILSTLIVIIITLLFLNGKISELWFRPIAFIYLLILIIAAFRIYFVYLVKKFAKVIGFKMITPFYLQPKIEGIYKNNWWQIHFVNKEAGASPSVFRTYIKLQWKEPKKFDEKKLKKYSNMTYNGNKIISIEHEVRTYKNYLLLRRAWFTFDKNKIHELMDLLLKIAKESETK